MAGPTPKTIASYEIVRELGRGGMGVVYLAHHLELQRHVVLKTLRRDVEDEPEVEERFTREAQAAAGVHHQNVVAVYDCFAWRGRPYIAQEYVEGVDLATVLLQVPRLAPRVAALVALELIRGLEEIHEEGVVHRDVKPSNVLLGRAGAVKIADFGIALDGKAPSLTQTGHTVGTPRYMSPEQLFGERVDLRSDLFSLGVVLYEMLTGRAPFADEDPERDEALVRRIESGRYTRIRRLAPDAPRWLVRLVRSCLRPKAKRRPGSAAIVRARLERCLGGPSPGDARREIAAWLHTQGVFLGQSDGTEMAPFVVPRRRCLPRLAWAAAAAAAVALAVGAWMLGHAEQALALWTRFG